MTTSQPATDASRATGRGRRILFAFWSLCVLAVVLEWVLDYQTIPLGGFWWPTPAATAALTAAAFLIPSCRAYLVDLAGLSSDRRNWKSLVMLLLLVLLSAVGINASLDVANGVLADRRSEEHTVTISSRHAWQSKWRHYEICAPYWGGSPREFCVRDIGESEYDRSVPGRTRLWVKTRTGWFGVPTIVEYKVAPAGP